MESEHRHAPQYQFIAEAEVTEILSNTNLIAKTSDLSIGGCFLDTLNPSPEGTDVLSRSLDLTLEEHRRKGTPQGDPVYQTIMSS